MTGDFSRALASLLARVGGPVSNSLDEVALELATRATAAGATLARQLADLERQLEQGVALAARLAELRKQVAALEAALVNVATPTDWEHPGKIGAATPNTGRFTTVNRVTITAPVGGATLTLSDGKTFAVSSSLTLAGADGKSLTVLNSVGLAGVDGKTFTLSNTLGLAGTDGAALNIGNGGTLGSAAFKDASAFAASTNTSLAPVATDAASTQTLANSLRAALISVGIGS